MTTAWFVFGIVAVLALLAIQIVVFYACAWIVLVGMRHLPMVGRGHRHPEWQHLQRGGMLDTLRKR